MTTTIKSRPILFSGPMAKAILDGRKTMTRRIVKPQPEHAPMLLNHHDRDRWSDGFDFIKPCPYGMPGDRLWVRETWMPLWDSGAGFHTCLSPSGQENNPDTIKYRADGEKPPNFGDDWRPSIHMPRRHSRLTLEVTGVRVERVQDISEEDAEAEGIDDGYLVRHKVPPPRAYSFRHLWDSINAKRGFGWDANPWVWVVDFKRITP